MPLLVLLGFSLLLGARTQAPEQGTVTFSEPAAPLSRLMPRLADVTKQPLKVSKAMETDVVCVSVHDVTVTDLLKKVADATGGMWTQSDGAYYLSPSVGGRETIKARSLKARAAKLAIDLKKMDPSNQKPKPKATPGQPDVSMFQGDTGDPVFYQLLTAIGPQQLATLLTGDRVVLSTRPTARQYPLPVGDDVLANYIQRHNAEADRAAEKAKRQAGAGDADGGEGPPMPTGFSGFGNHDRINGHVEKALLIITRSQGIVSIMGNGEISAELVLYDAAGKEVGRDHAGL